MNTQANEQVQNETYLIGKLVTFTFKESVSESASIEGFVAGYADIAGERCAYMFTNTGEEFFIPLSNVAYLMISNKGIESSQIIKDGTQVAYDKLPEEKRPPINEDSVLQDSDVAQSDTVQSDTIESAVSEVSPTSNQLISSLTTALTKKPAKEEETKNETE